MGFGLQKWIYSRKPRTKLYARERIPSFTSLPKYSRTFKLQPSIKENKILVGILTVLVVIGFLVLLISCYNKFTVYSNERTEIITMSNNYADEQAFNFLLNSGKNRLQENRILDAYSELKLAYNISPNNRELNQVFVEVLTILCNNDSIHCSELDALMLSNY